jgi:hypothetical protein
MKLKYTDINKFTISRKDIELPYTPGLAIMVTTPSKKFLIHTKPAYYCKYNLWRADSDFVVINFNQLRTLITKSYVLHLLEHWQELDNSIIELVPTTQVKYFNSFIHDTYDNFDYHPLRKYDLTSDMPSTPKHLRGGRADVVRPRSEKQSRNALCRCGSGCKYKHCCYLKS